MNIDQIINYFFSEFEWIFQDYKLFIKLLRL
jgi:hypothetical protein